MAVNKIEKVTNDSGSGYCKMPDGTLMCWGAPSKSVAASSTDEIAVTYPIAFTASPIVGLAFLGHVPSVFNVSYENNTTNGMTIRGQNTYSGALNLNVSWIAIGRWK